MRFPEIITQLSNYTTPSKPLYLVGGAVRDSLLARPCVDFDLVCTQDSGRIARTFANAIKGDCFALDEERDTYRVLIDDPSLNDLVIDFSAMRGENIREDLSKRDFTINAMAVDLFEPDRVIDPFKGGRDLQQKMLRVVSAESFADDPLRTIRAVRYAVDLGLRMETGMPRMLTASVKGLEKISAERKRDELFKIFSRPKVHTALQLLNQFDVFKYIPLEVAREFSQVVTHVRALEDVLDWLCGEKTHERQAAFYQSSLLVEMGRFRAEFGDYFLAKNQSRRDRRSLLYLAATLDDSEHLEWELRSMALSVDEIQMVCRYHMYIPIMDALVNRGAEPEPIDIYRFFKTTGSVGIDLAVRCLADYTSRIGSEFSQTRWLYLLKTAGTLADAWFRRPDLIKPAPLLDGEMLMRRFSLDPGPVIGELLEMLKEEQVKGSITNEVEALELVKKRIEEMKK